MKLEFDGQKNEPDMIVNVPIELLLKSQCLIIVMKYIVKKGEWESVMISDTNEEDYGAAEFK